MTIEEIVAEARDYAAHVMWQHEIERLVRQAYALGLSGMPHLVKGINLAERETNPKTSTPDLVGVVK